MSQIESVEAARAGYKCWVVGDKQCFLTTGCETGGSYAVVESTIPPGGGTPLHTHTREDEGFYVLEGEVEFHVDDRVIVVGAGGFAHAPKDVPHFYANKSGKTARMLVTLVPAGLEEFFAEVGAPVDEANAVAPPPDLARIMEIAPKYGLVIHPPENA